MTYFRLTVAASILALSASLSPAVIAKTSSSTTVVSANSPAIVAPALPQFVPHPNGRNIRLDYEVLDDALGGTVIRFGPSTRRYMSRPRAQTGSRYVNGHTSGYRLEGSRVSFSFFSKEYLEELVAYREDLERIANQIDLTGMPRDEQLAFWFNLHNVALIEQVSKQYPKKRPSKLKVDGVALDEAKILNIKNTPLSLRDIRERIVYPNWSQPEVIYGFFRGDIGSPALQNYAYTGGNVHEVLKIQADEFANALRGFNLGGKNRKVSKLYFEAQPFFFPNFETDVKAHLLKYARPEVAEDLRVERPFIQDRYDDVVADLVGGSRPRIARSTVTSGGDYNEALPDEVVRLLRELNTKTQVLRTRKLINTGGTVTIEDIETVDVYIPD